MTHQFERSHMKIALSIVATVFLTHGALANDFLKPDQIQNLLVGKKILAQAANGSMVEFQMNSDFTATTSAAGGDTGRWRLSEEGYCTTWIKIRQGNESCFRISKLGANHFVIGPDGSRSRIVRID
jgi:hypothetical protein